MEEKELLRLKKSQNFHRSCPKNTVFLLRAQFHNCPVIKVASSSRAPPGRPINCINIIYPHVFFRMKTFDQLRYMCDQNI